MWSLWRVEVEIVIRIAGQMGKNVSRDQGDRDNYVDCMLDCESVDILCRNSNPLNSIREDR